ncbi:hypothetical protein crov158 [Cafeteria roenbergensis virus]|uniref:Uncharacterized protein n=1 Tax=Cafeteria roenbergensis virus (strain BV-PW1) TaxID=693272 RepID=E3T4S8_CROVB|nr:hypothetical protein crov158 [Cafeteria roenbergensis virus BV-PW1]ADO67191.1 hypothetical protein crov158 [Cafeteria roenbergensis virus BV-PW1]
MKCGLFHITIIVHLCKLVLVIIVFHAFVLLGAAGAAGAPAASATTPGTCGSDFSKVNVYFINLFICSFKVIHNLKN